FAYSAPKRDDFVLAGVGLVVNFAEQDVDDLLRQRLVTGDPGDVAGEMVPEVTEDGFQVGWPLEILPAEKPDVLDALPFSRDVWEIVVGAATVPVVDLPKVDVILTIEPCAHLRGAHVHVELQLCDAILASFFLALDDHIQVVFKFVGVTENCNID